MEETVLSTAEPRGSEYNQKPRFISFMIAGLIDIFLIFLASFGIYQIELNTPISSQLNTTNALMAEIERDYWLEYDVAVKSYEFDESERSTKVVYSDDQGEYILVRKEDATQDRINEAINAVKANQDYQSLQFNYKLVNYGLKMIAAGSSEFLLVFLVPLLSRKRYTIGRLAGGVVLIRRKRQDKASVWNLLARFFWVLLIDTALPALVISEIIIFLIVAAGRLIVRGIDREHNRCILDLITGAICVSKETYRPINEQ